MKWFLWFAAIGSLMLSACDEEAPVQPTDHPLLWRIDGDKPSYLFGTIHVPDPRVVVLPEVVEQALRSATATYTELKMDKVSQVRATGRMMLPDQQTLKDVLPATTHQRLEEYLQSRGLSLAGLERLQIWAVQFQLTLLENLELMGGQALDVVLYEMAQSLGQEVGGLETYEEQLGVFDSFNYDEQAKFLEDTLDELEEAAREGKSLLGELVELYLSGDEVKILEFMHEQSDPDDEANQRFLKLLLTDRNVRMAQRAAKKMRESPEQAYFFAVGAAHMPGDDGVVALLRKQGFDVQRVTVTETQ